MYLYIYIQLNIYIYGAIVSLKSLKKKNMRSSQFINPRDVGPSNLE